MKIAIDLTSIPSQKTGVGKYAIALIKALGKFDDENQYWIFVKRNQAEEFDPKKKNFHIILCNNILQSKILRILWEQFVLPVILLKKRIKLLHSIHYTTPLLFLFKRITAFHDMTFFLFPKKHTFTKRIFFQLIIPLSAKRSDRLIADSRSTKRDIQKILGVSMKKIDVVYGTVNPIYHPVENINAINGIKSQYKIKDRFILYVGTLEPRKNVVGLIRAYYKLVLEKGIKHQLVVVGKKGWGYQEIFKTAQDLNLDKKIIFTGYVPDNELVFFYNAADIFMYPSLYEGFGIPPLEALSCGTPTISSNISSMPEVVGNAGILVNPYNVQEISQKMYELLVNKKLRLSLREKGLLRAKKFSEEKMAKETIESYEKASEEHN